MVLQLEDVMDVLDALFSEPFDGDESPHTRFVPNSAQAKARVRKFEYLFLTDHSCGHDRKREDGLDTSGLRKTHTAAAPKMRDVEITNDVGVLSNDFTHTVKLNVGDVQNIWYSVILIILVTLR